jgi:hypothetical protein
MAFLYEITFVPYISMIIYLHTLCKWLDYTILNTDTKQKITLGEKLNVTCEVEAKSKTLRYWNCNLSWIGPSSLSIITLNKNKIIEGEIKCGAHSKKRMNIKLGANKGLENILLQWFQQMCPENVTATSRPILRKKAAGTALRLKVDNFKSWSGWLYRHLKWTMKINFLLKVYIIPI